MKVFLRILLETDGPYMAVEKGGISLPGDAIYIALRVAQLKGMDWLTVVKATRENRWCSPLSSISWPWNVIRTLECLDGQ